MRETRPLRARPILRNKFKEHLVRFSPGAPSALNNRPQIV